MTWWLLTVLASFSMTLDQFETKKLANARSAHEVAQIQAQTHDIRVSRLACRLQLQEGLVPISCYRALLLEQKFGLRTNSDARHKLDRKCAIAVRTAQSLPDFEVSTLSPSCRAEVLRARELLAYKLE